MSLWVYIAARSHREVVGGPGDCDKRLQGRASGHRSHSRYGCLGLLQKRVFGIASLDYRLVGRWIDYFQKGKFAHDAISKAAPLPGEVLPGWAAHYAISVPFAVILVVVWRLEWLHRPTLAPALTVGVGSIVAPFFLMQRALGIGVAASRTLGCPLSQPDRPHLLWNRALRIGALEGSLLRRRG